MSTVPYCLKIPRHFRGDYVWTKVGLFYFWDLLKTKKYTKVSDKCSEDCSGNVSPRYAPEQWGKWKECPCIAVYFPWWLLLLSDTAELWWSEGNLLGLESQRASWRKQSSGELDIRPCFLNLCPVRATGLTILQIRLEKRSIMPI